MLKGNAQYGKEFGRSITVPILVKVFMLSACKNTLPAKANLVKRKVVEDPLYPVGGADVETTGHVFWKCTVARDTWSLCGRRLQKSREWRVYSYCGRAAR
jgi:hypothetical protein